MAQVGDIVLFRIGLETQRPLLVVSADGPQISGELFLDWDFDRNEEWVTKGYMKTPPSPNDRTTEVRGAMLGSGIGQWSTKAADSTAAAHSAEAARANIPVVVKPIPEVAPLPQPSHPVGERPPLQKIQPIRRGPIK
jgi:hypothetical protein